MSTTLLEVRTDARSVLVEPTARFFSDAELNRWINQGQKAWSSKVLWYEKIACQKAVQYKAEYTIPAEFMKVELVVWNEQYRIRTIDESEWIQIKYQRSDQINVIPFVALLYPFDKRIALHSAPASSSPSTTLSANISASETTIPVASTTGFPNTGRALIGTEQIRYYAITSTSLLQCVRGEGDTTAVNHSQNDVVDYGSICLYGRALPPDLSSDVDMFKLSDIYIEALVFYAAYKGFLKRGTSGELAKGLKMLEKFEMMRDEAARERMETAKDGSSGIHDEETGMGFYADV